ncbi:hypothetical protein JYK00_03790 [Thermosipho ferrireducens]|uniref:Dockerin domain-containing protein n=1 Tax=Thermosipho ferrireducens TaxID=2571116 RepID=A0ABX7SAZ5_9BACT|nr:hypothetical protein [Thermosipho ferrireducens]QTA38641.1 hypothetical protein JYK00_03790 [Thermosipho ferrireducens]
MKKVLLLMFLISGALLFASVSITNLWVQESINLNEDGGAGIVMRNTGDIYAVTKGGYLWIINKLGKTTKIGANPQLKNIMSYPVYVNGALFYVSWEWGSNADNKLVVRYGTGFSTSASTDLTTGVYGAPVVFETGGNYHIYFADANGMLYHYMFDGTNFSLPSTTTLNSGVSVKAPVILSPSKDAIFVIDSNGTFYRVALDGSYNFGTKSTIAISDKFFTPMAYSEKYIYVASVNGKLYKIPPAGTAGEVKSVDLKSSVTTSGVLVDGNGYVYVFNDGGYIEVFDRDLTYYASYNVGSNMRFSTTPLIFKKSTENRAYILVLLVSVGSTEGKAQIYTFDYDTKEISGPVWEKDLKAAVPIQSAPAIVAEAGISEDRYIFAFVDNKGNVYAYRVDARGPYGDWAMAGQNAYRTGFIDDEAITFYSYITIKAYEGINGREISKTIYDPNDSGKYGLLYDATVLALGDATTLSGYIEYKTNPYGSDAIPSGRAGLDKLFLKFSSPTALTLLFSSNFVFDKVGNGIGAPTIDATFAFNSFDSATVGLEGPNGSNEATITFGYNDKVVKVWTDATYAVFIKYKTPDGYATELKNILYKYNDPNETGTFEIDATNPPTSVGDDLFPYKWFVYQWDPDEVQGYKSEVYGAEDKITLNKTGPAYIEIYYTPLTGTVTFVTPRYGYRSTKAYILLDAATDAVLFNLNITFPSSVVKFSTIVNIEINPNINFSEVEVLRDISSDNIDITLDSGNPISGSTRVATITAELDFTEPKEIYFLTNTGYTQYFDVSGFVQLKTISNVSTEIITKTRFISNKFLSIVGDFDLDGDVDVNDYNAFMLALGTSEGSPNYSEIYDIYPRAPTFNGPYPTDDDYDPGVADPDGKIDAFDLAVMLMMFGWTAPSTALEYTGN